MALQYLISPIIQLEDTNGQTLVNGKVYVYHHDTDVLATIYKDFIGGEQSNPAILDELGTTIIIADNETSYDIELYDANDNFILSRKMVFSNGGGGADNHYTYDPGVDIQFRQISENRAFIDVVNNNCSNTNYGFAIGYHTSADGYGVSMGKNTVATNHGIAGGDNTVASNTAIAFGYGSEANNHGISLGIRTSAANYGIAQGSDSYATNGAVVIGTYCSGTKPHSLSLGDSIDNKDEASLVVGYNITATGLNAGHSVIAGVNHLLDGDNVYNNIIGGDAQISHSAQNILSIGLGNTANSSHEAFILGGVGNEITTATYGGIVGGAGNKVSGTNSIVIGGNGNSAKAAGTVIAGNGCIAEDSNSIAVQNGTSAFAGGFAQGSICIASGGQSHAQGWNTSAMGVSNHAEGGDTLASGTESHAEGGYTSAIGNCSHSEGHDTVAVGAYSHAEGHGTIAVADHQTVMGRYNATGTTDIMQVGCGELGSPANAMTVDVSGSVNVNTLTGLKNTRTFFDNLGEVSYYHSRNIPIFACTGTDYEPITTTGTTGMYAAPQQDFPIANVRKVKVDGFYQIKGGMNVNGTVPNFGADPKIQFWANGTQINTASLTNGYWLPRSVPIPFSFVTGGTTSFKIGFCSEGTWTATNMDTEHGGTAGNILINYTTTILDQE
jgi:hypothetical protein